MRPVGVSATVVAILCSAFLVAGQRPRLRELHLSSYGVGFRYALSGDAMALISVSTNATSSPRSDDITGTNLWVSELFASRNADGAGLKAVIERQLLDARQQSRPLPSGGTLGFTTPYRVDLAALASFPYLCVKLSKSSTAYPDYHFFAGNQNYVVHCRSIQEGTRALEAQRNQRPQVSFTNFEVNYQYEFQTISTMRDPLVYLTGVTAATETLTLPLP